MEATFAALLEFEMLDRVCDIDAIAINSGFLQRAIEEFACRSHKRMTFDIFLIARLFAHQGKIGMKRAFTQHCARAALHHGRGIDDQAVERRQ